jgi:thioredoxin 1
MAVRAVTDSTFDEEVGQADALVVVDYWADWCGPCRMMAPILDGVAANYAGGVDVVKVNIDENPALVERFDIKSVPTISIMRGGAEVKRLTGPRSRSALIREIATEL